MYQDNSPVQEKLKNLKFDWRNKRVVDLGCNIGLLAQYLFYLGIKEYVGIDYNPSFIEEGLKRNPNLDLRCEDVTKVKLETDVLIALGLFHHLRKEEMIKVITNNVFKYLIVEVPTGEKEGIFRTLETEDWYINLLDGYCDIIGVYDSGMKLPKEFDFKRKIFVCEAS